MVEVDLKDAAQFEKTVAVVAKAFAGTERTPPELIMDWVLGPTLSKKWTDPRRAELMGWFQGVNLTIDLGSGNGTALAVRTKDGEGFGAAIQFRLYPNGYEEDGFFANMSGAMKMGIPPWVQEPLKSEGGDGIGKRCESLGKELHKKYGSEPHYYISVVAVDPASQGQGLGGLLMRFVSKLADEKGLMCYLEAAGEKNPAIYKRYGYEIVGKGEFSCKDDPDNSGSIPVAAMIRPAKK